MAQLSLPPGQAIQSFFQQREDVSSTGWSYDAPPPPRKAIQMTWWAVPLVTLISKSFSLMLTPLKPASRIGSFVI